MRQSYIERELYGERNTQTRQLEVRNEQLQAEKERLLYDNAFQRRGRSIDDDDRSAIRRGLLAAPASRTCLGDTKLAPATTPVDADSSEAGTPRFPSDPPPAPSLPPGPPSSKCSSRSSTTINPGESIVSIYLSGEPSAAPLTENAGVKRGRAALVAPTFLAPGTRPGLEPVDRVERVELAELAALAEMADDETVAALQNVISSGHVSSTCSTAQAPHCGVVPAQTNLQTAGAMIVAQLPHVLRTWDPSPLQAKFHALVMCNFTPRNPRELPPSRWVSYDTLFRLFQPHAPVWQVGPGNLKQLIIEWFQGHPAFAGLVTSVWCKRIRVTEQSRTIYKFSFEHTPQ